MENDKNGATNDWEISKDDFPQEPYFLLQTDISGCVAALTKKTVTGAAL